MADGTHSALRRPPLGQLEGNHCRLFSAAPANFGSEDETKAVMRALAAQMVTSASAAEDPQLQDSVLPAGYTYFGQLIAHDVTFDPSNINRRKVSPDASLDHRTPRFDLDCVYGRGPEVQPYFYQDERRFSLGEPLRQKGRDLPRLANRESVALIADPRNDMTFITSQLHGLFMQLHNRFVDEHDFTFEQARAALRHHYQLAILTDFLPSIVGDELLDELLEQREGRFSLKGISPLRWGGSPALPVEFSMAAFRFGHSMVRPAYRLNRILPEVPLMSEEPTDSVAFFAKPALPLWHIDWDLFFDIPGQKRGPFDRDRLQMAHQIDACLTKPLGNLPPIIENLAMCNLLRGVDGRLPSGQAVARAMCVTPLADEQIFVGAGVPIAEVSLVFKQNCPVWAYVLAEAHAARAADLAAPALAPGRRPRQLGEVGGRIVAETFLMLMAADPTSILHADPPFVPILPAPTCNLAALVAAAEVELDRAEQ